MNKLDFTDPASKRASVWDPIGHVVTLEQELAIQKYLMESLPSSDRQVVHRSFADVAVVLFAMNVLHCFIPVTWDAEYPFAVLSYLQTCM